MKILRGINEYLEEYFLVSSLIVMVAIVFLQVIMRYVFENSLSWSEELARYLFLWQVWIGASFATKKSRHLRVEILPNSVPEKIKPFISIFATVISLCFAIFLTYKAFEITSLVHASRQITPALGLRMSIPYASVPVGMALMVFRLLQNLYLDIKKPFSKEV